MSTLSYLDSSRDPQSNDTASVQSRLFYASLAIALAKLENFSDTVLLPGVSIFRMFQLNKFYFVFVTAEAIIIKILKYY